MMYFFLSCSNPSGTSTVSEESVSTTVIQEKKSSVPKWVGQEKCMQKPAPASFSLSLPSCAFPEPHIFDAFRNFDSSLFSGWEYTKETPFVQCGNSFFILFSTTLLDSMWLRVSGTMKGGKADGKISIHRAEQEDEQVLPNAEDFSLIFSGDVRFGKASGNWFWEENICGNQRQQWDEGKRVGSWSWTLDGGIRQIQSQYVDGVLEGDTSLFTPKGVWKGKMSKGKPVGTWTKTQAEAVLETATCPGCSLE